MTAGEAVFYVIVISFLVGLVTGWIVRKNGYSFWYYAVSSFIASCGILGIIFKIIMDYV